MIVFDQLRVADAGDKIYIDIRVNSADYYENITFDSIVITTSDNIREASVESLPSKYIYKKVYSEDSKTDSLVIEKADLDAAFNNTDSEGNPIDSTKPSANTPYNKSDFNSDLFFVYVKGKGIIGECAPCTSDVSTGVTFNNKTVYQNALQFTKELLVECKVPTDFVNFILQWEAFKSSIETGHYIPAIKFWNLLLGNTSGYSGSANKKCGCHG